MSNNDNTQNKSRKTNKFFQDITKEDLNAIQNNSPPQIRLETRTREEYATIPLPENPNTDFHREERPDAGRQPTLHISPPQTNHLVRSPSTIDGYYSFPPVYYSPPPPTYYHSPRSGYLPPYFSSPTSFFPASNAHQQNPVTIFVSSPTYNPTATGYSVSPPDSYPSPAQTNEQYTFAHRQPLPQQVQHQQQIQQHQHHQVLQQVQHQQPLQQHQQHQIQHPHQHQQVHQHQIHQHQQVHQQNYQSQGMQYQQQLPQQPYPAPGAFTSNAPTPSHTMRFLPPQSPASTKSTPKTGGGGGGGGGGGISIANLGGRKPKSKPKCDEHRMISIGMIKGHVLEIAVDQTKCRELQHYLKEGGIDGSTHYSPLHILQIIFEDICQHAFTIIVNPFGNYLFQKVYEYSNHEQRVLLISSLIISTRLADASCNKHGSRCVQHMIKHSVGYPDLVEIIVQSLAQHIYRLCVDENGNHVIQYCLEKLTVEQNSFIFQLISESCLDICKQRYGNRVMQKCIRCAVEGYCPDFTAQIVAHSYDLITDEFGNYIVQHMLVTCPHHIDAICRSVIGSITSLSKQKHASVVIEKCFQSGSYEVLRHYLDEITHHENLSTLIQDPFGNYVVQNALKYLPIELKHRFVETLLTYIELIKQMPWGLQIISKMCSDTALTSPNHLATSVMPTDTAPTPSSVL